MLPKIDRVVAVNTRFVRFDDIRAIYPVRFARAARTGPALCARLLPAPLLHPYQTWPGLAPRGDLTAPVVALGTRLLGRVAEAESAVGSAGPVTLVHGDAPLDPTRVMVAAWRVKRRAR